MGEWTRQTQWRQGALLSGRSAIALNLLREDEASSQVLIAISHDCDIAADNLNTEPNVEFIVGTIVDKIDGAYTRAKNSRLLHLEFETPDGIKAVEFAIRNRIEICKAALADHAPDVNWSHVSPKGVISLRWWLAARYFRSSFPDTFEARLRQKSVKLDEKIDKLISPHGEAIYGIFFLVDDGAGYNREDGEPHELIALLVYDSESGDDQIKAVEKAADAICNAFKAKLYDEESSAWKEIELVNCLAISDQNFSYADSRNFKQWRLEHRSLEDNAQPLPVQGA